jgi:antitoxin (DNA-binding transcriptional repressor) of toxin-antitoxin stability system
MQKATISELKNSLSAYLKKVRAGQTVVIYDRDQPVARLERIEGGSGVDDRLERLERAGLMRRGTGSDPLELLKDGAPKSKRSVTQALIEERRESR